MVAGTYMIQLKSSDVVYSPLPLYHLAAGLLGSGQALLSGVTVVLKKKFSVSAYWKDCVKYNCTVREVKPPLTMWCWLVIGCLVHTMYCTYLFLEGVVNIAFLYLLLYCIIM